MKDAIKLTLTRHEAQAVEGLLRFTDGQFYIDPVSSPEELEPHIRRMCLEVAFRDDAGWWETRPGLLATRENLGKGTCPDEFTISADAVLALVELLPLAFGDGEPEHEEAVLGLAARLGVEIRGAGATA